MDRAELEACAERALGRLHGSARHQVGLLADHLRADEQVVALAVAVRSVLIGGGCLIAATDQRLLLAWMSSEVEDIGWAELVAITDDREVNELALVTRDRVHTLKLAPTPGTRELIAAVAARVGEDRVHASAGGAEARRIMRAAAAAIVCGCVFFALRLACDREPGDRESAGPTPKRLAKGTCLDPSARLVACDAAGALFVIRGPRDMRSCSRASPTIVKSIATTPASRRELSRWCVGVNTRER